MHRVISAGRRDSACIDAAVAIDAIASCQLCWINVRPRMCTHNPWGVVSRGRLVRVSLGFQCSCHISGQIDLIRRATLTIFSLMSIHYTTMAGEMCASGRKCVSFLSGQTKFASTHDEMRPFGGCLSHGPTIHVTAFLRTHLSQCCADSNDERYHCRRTKHESQSKEAVSGRCFESGSLCECRQCRECGESDEMKAQCFFERHVLRFTHCWRNVGGWRWLWKWFETSWYLRHWIEGEIHEMQRKDRGRMDIR